VLRRWLASLLPQCPARDDVTAVAHELGANAVQHTSSGRGGRFAVEVTWYGPVVRIAVADSGAPTRPQVIDDPGGEHGRGLLVVRGLSVRTGVCGDRRGRLVWADVRWDADAAAPAVAPDAYEAAIHDGEAALARRFAGVPAWFGRATLAWWALAGTDGLVTAPTARDLAGLLYRLLDTPASPQPPAAGHAHPGAAEQSAQQAGRGPGAVGWTAVPVEPSRAGRTGMARPGTSDGRRPARGNRPAFIPELLTTGAGPACA